MAEDYKDLEQKMIDFYNQSRSLFIDVPPNIDTDSMLPMLPEALFENPSELTDGTFFSFLPNIDLNTMGSTTQRVNEEPPMFFSHIIVNFMGHRFEKFLKDGAGFEDTLLHEMVHIKDKMMKEISFEYWHTKDFDYITACHLIARVHPITEEGKPLSYLWERAEKSNSIRDHGVRFMTLCYYLAKNLLKKKKLLKKLLRGKKVVGDTLWEKRAWLAGRIYARDPFEFIIEYDEFLRRKALREKKR